MKRNDGPDTSAASSAQDDIAVEIHTDEGVTGIGESDINPWIARACIDAPGTHNMGLGLREMLIGEDPLDVEGLWERLYVGSAMNGRRGAVINAIGAIDYGFRAVKAEVTLEGPYAHQGLREPWERSTEVLAAVRNAIGPEVDLLVDVQYALPDAATALSVLADWEQFDLYFVETPLWPDDLDGYRRLTREQPIRIAAGEWPTTRFEHLDLIDRGGVQIVQPDIGRVGGLTEARRVCAIAADRGRRIIPHLWKTGISIAAAAHLAVVTENCDYVEFLPPDVSESGLRKELTSGELEMVGGVIPLPTRPGLGVEIDPEALARFSVEAEALGVRS